jgi:hypothetical protein
MRERRLARPYRDFLRRGLAGLVLSLALLTPARGQSGLTLEERLQEVLFRCAAQIPRPDSLRTIELRDRFFPPTAYPEWMRALRSAGWELAVGAEVPRLEVLGAEGRVRYRRLGRKGLERAISLFITYRILSPDDRVLTAGRCSSGLIDTLSRLSQPEPIPNGWPLEREEISSPPSWWERYLQPLLLAGSTAVLLYLLFTVRSAGSS